MDILKEYLSHIDEMSKVQLNEGIGSIANKIFLFLGYGMPKDPQVKALNKNQYNCYRICRKAFPAEVSTTRKRSSDTLRVPYDPYNWDERKARKDQEETSKTIKENPEYGKCILKCKLEYLKNVLKVLKKKGKKLCVRNKNVSLCEKWVEKYIPEFEAELKSIQVVLDKTNPKKGNVSIVINKLLKTM